MNPREKILAIATAGMLAVAVGFLVVHKLLIAPARARDAEAVELRAGNADLRRDLRRMEPSKAKFARLRDRTFDDNPHQVSLLVTSRLNELVKRAGMGEQDVKVTPSTRIGGRAKEFSEVGCTVSSVRGTSLERITNLLFLLDRDPYLHRVSNVEVTPRDDMRSFDFSLRYTTPVFDRPRPVAVEPRKAPTTQMAEGPSLTHSGRTAYDVIHRRNLFRPYLPPRPVPREVVQRPPERRGPERQPPPPPTSPFDRLVVTGLPSRGDVAEVHLTTPGRDVEKVYKVGDKLPVGQVAMVDYRVLPHPEDPKRLSASRLILRIGKDYWRVELGQRIEQRRALRPSELPEQLKPKPARVESPVATTRPAKT